MIKILVSLEKVAQTFQILTFFPMEYIDYFGATELSLSGMASNLPKKKNQKNLGTTPSTTYYTYS